MLQTGADGAAGRKAEPRKGLGSLSALTHHCGFTTVGRKDDLIIYQAHYMLHFESPLLLIYMIEM